MTIAWLGTGLLGANFVRAMRKRGETVRVWNRTFDKAKALEAEGAAAFADPAEAVRGAQRIHVALQADETVDEALARARPGMSPGAAIVDHTTTTAEGARARLARWDEAGLAFLHAPVFMGPPDALNGTGVMLGSGDKARFDALLPALEPMTGKVVYLGPDPTRAAAFKLMGNLLLMSISAACADIVKLGKSMDVPPEEAITMFDWLNPPIAPRMQRVITADFANPYWQLHMARKDARLMQEAAGDVRLLMIEALAAEMDRWIESGHAGQDWMVISKA